MEALVGASEELQLLTHLFSCGNAAIWKHLIPLTWKIDNFHSILTPLDVLQSLPDICHLKCSPAGQEFLSSK